MEWSGRRSSSGVDREMLEKLGESERDNCNDAGRGEDAGLSFGGAQELFEEISTSFGGVIGVLGLSKVATDIKKPVDAAPSPLISGSEMYLAISSRISSGDKIYDDTSSAASKASSSSTGSLEVIVIV